MKQFVGLYAVGCSKPDAILTAGQFVTGTPVYLAQLASDKNLPSEPRFFPLGLMAGLKVGLYVAVVTFENGIEAKVLPFKLGSEQMLKDTISEHLNAQCLASLDKLFGAVTDEGEATPAYVNQDQS
ncbi:hypothetical protein [Enterobacter phage EspM4VN]|uniref:Uncharacterized protein n=1 Tax=Enterobacter phage EspM4VN TaxID=2137745 RepID=A0A4P2WVB5_9CAUD|nr:hypothetical protein HYP11_gp174 [Enterobacter phage EspM4VN]BBK03791.1 hypothetical protein [Enterobacter phage EspM4VN]